MANKVLTLALVAGFAFTAACASKPKDLPPPPPTTTAPPVEAPLTGGPVTSTTTVPGSNADFLARAGSDHVLFALDSYEIDSTARAILDSQANWLNQYSQVTITIEGHADERGTREYNLALGERRANAAKNYLAGRGVSASRITTISYGKERPIVLGSNEAAWAQNRRAVTVLVSGMAN